MAPPQDSLERNDEEKNKRWSFIDKKIPYIDNSDRNVALYWYK